VQTRKREGGGNLSLVLRSEGPGEFRFPSMDVTAYTYSILQCPYCVTKDCASGLNNSVVEPAKSQMPTALSSGN
jgi:hypothetical protein